MSIKKNLQVALVGTLLLSAVSCGSDNKSSSPVANQETNTLCAENEVCADTVNWKILLEGSSFPESASVKINDFAVIDECHDSKSEIKIDRTTNPESITLKDFFVPKRGELKIVVSDCAAEVEVLSNTDVDFSVEKDGETRSILVRL